MVRSLALALASFAVTACRLAPAPEPSVASDAGLQVRLVKIEHASAAELAQIIQEVCENRVSIYRSFRGSAGSFSSCTGWVTATDAPPAPAPQQVAVAHTATNTLVLLGTEVELCEMLDLVARLDVPESQVHDR
jgi:type II secretory pathway component GspD/PulD (secretin)